MQRLLHVAIIGVLAVNARAGEVDAVPVPEQIGYVSDYGRVIDPADERRLVDISEELERKTGVRVRVVTVPTLGGADIDQVSPALLKAWGDSAMAARTILILDAIAEKKARIELGVGLNSIVTPEVSHTVQKQVMLPLLSRGDRGEAYLLAVTELSVAIGLYEKVALYSVPGYLKLQPAVFNPRAVHSEKLPELLLFIPLLIFMVGMVRLENRLACATVVFGAVFRRNWRRRIEWLKRMAD
ncbi:MAG: TPM domain-containing protein [bacterium]|nr:TPM domain-containing protein [bacterium]